MAKQKPSFSEPAKTGGIMSLGSDFFVIVKIIKAIAEALIELAMEGKIEK